MKYLTTASQQHFILMKMLRCHLQIRNVFKFCFEIAASLCNCFVWGFFIIIFLSRKKQIMGKNS